MLSIELADQISVSFLTDWLGDSNNVRTQMASIESYVQYEISPLRAYMLEQNLYALLTSIDAMFGHSLYSILRKVKEDKVAHENLGPLDAGAAHKWAKFNFKVMRKIQPASHMILRAFGALEDRP